MARLRINGEVYDVPDSDVRIAMSQYGAVPADAPADTLEGTGPSAGGIAGGVAGNALNSIGGLGGIAKLGGAGALAYGGYRALKGLRNRMQPPAPPAPPAAPPARTSAAAPRPSSSLVELTEDDIARFPQFKNAQPGETVRRSLYESVKFPKDAPPDRRTKPKAKAKAKAAPTGVVRDPSGAPGASGPELLERRNALMEIAARKGGPERVAALEAKIPPPKVRAPRLRTMRGGGGNALGLLLALLDSGSLPEQMDEAGDIYRRADPMSRFLDDEPRGIY